MTTIVPFADATIKMTDNNHRILAMYKGLRITQNGPNQANGFGLGSVHLGISPLSDSIILWKTKVLAGRKARISAPSCS